MKIVSIIFLCIFGVSVFVSKTQVGNTIEEQKALQDVKDRLTFVDSRAVQAQSLVDKANGLDVSVIPSITRAAEELATSIDELIHLDSKAGNNLLVSTKDKASLKTLATEVSESANRLKANADSLEQLGESVQLIRQLGAELTAKTRLVTKALASGRSSQGQIFYASNQTYLVQFILSKVEELSSNPNTTIEDAQQIVKAAKTFKSTYDNMINGGKSGATVVRSKKAYSILIEGKVSTAQFMKVLTAYLGKYKHITEYRNSLDSFWSASNKLSGIAKKNWKRIDAESASAYEVFGLLDTLSLLSIIAAGVVGFAAYRKGVLEEAETSKQESQALDALKRELGEFEKGDLTKPLNDKHAYTSSAARNINSLVAMFNKLVRAIKGISGNLDAAVQPIATISKQQHLLEQKISTVIQSTEEETEKLAKISKRILGFGNEFTRLQKESTESLTEVKATSTQLSGNLNEMVSQSKNISVLNENIGHGVDQAKGFVEKTESLIRQLSSHLINATVAANEDTDESRTKLEQAIESANEISESILNSNNDVKVSLGTTVEQTANAVEQFEAYRSLISQIDSINHRTSELSSNQGDRNESLENCSKNLIGEVKSLYSIAESAIGLVGEVKVSASEANDASNKLVDVVNDTNKHINQLQDLIGHYKV